MPRRTIVDPRFPGRLRELRADRGLSLRALSRLTYLSKSYLHDFETGTRPPSKDHAAALDDALAAGGELAAMVRADSPLGYAVAHPRRADSAAVVQLVECLDAGRRLEDEVGSAAMLPSVTGQLVIVGDLIREAVGPVRRELVAVAAQWAQFGGWLNLDAGRHRRAGMLLDRALEWAAEAGDREMVATALSFKGHAAWLRGEVGPTIGLTEAALRDPTVHIGQRAYDRYQLARGHTAAGNRKAAAEALAAGAELADEAVEYGGPRPPWHYYRSRAFFALEAGLVHRLLGDGSRAADLLRDGLAGLPPEMRAAEWTTPYRKALAEALSTPEGADGPPLPDHGWSPAGY